MGDLPAIRTALFLPASNDRALEKAKGLAVDALILDLEDAVAPSDKARARDRVKDLLQSADARSAYGSKRLFVRLNATGSGFFADDAKALEGCPPDGLVLPKVEGLDDLAALPPSLLACPVFAMIETPLGVINAPKIASSGLVKGLIAGTNDLTADLGATPGPDRAELSHALQAIVLAARAYGLLALDGVFNAIADTTGLVAEAQAGRRLGFHGKCLIHPNQIDPVTTAFAPTAAEIAKAKDLIDAFAAAKDGVATHEGQMIEALHVEAARRLLKDA